MIRLVICLTVIWLALGRSAAADVTYPIHVKDALDRDVTITSQPKSVLLGSGFNLIALSLIHPDPVSLLAGWADDLKGDNPEIYAGFKERFPEIDALPIIGDGMTVSVEKLVSIKADLAILSDWQMRSDEGVQAIAYLEKMGIPVIVVDFGNHALQNTSQNMRLLGKVLNREEQANAFADFYDERIARIRDRVAKNGAGSNAGPTVLLEAFPNADQCCYAYGRSSMGEFITLTGSRNIAADGPPQGAIISSEYIVAADPQVYIATSSPGGKYSGFSIGPGVSEQEARDTLSSALKNPFRAGLKAVHDKRVHGLWNFFNAVPLNILAAETFAVWLRPELFADISPEATLVEINRRFAAVPFEGSYWISLKP
ncbi:ABC transporter substrate-binding protein [Brucella oryzae]|uniref:ABC transporter substrate-binding protein n=1 Tax=Brucella oryzae TaxID=335286 RepID=UPI001B83451F|nr:ABC transporter substrate-binding protein [Brucella oryzae]MBR7654490.1 ABC transporter substrate-binding protein [Brucella oryzae]